MTAREFQDSLPRITEEFLNSCEGNEEGFRKICFLLHERAVRAWSFFALLCEHAERSEDETFERNSAIIVGMISRVQKYANDFSRELKENRLENASVFLRIVYETIVNVMYLIKHRRDTDLFDRYVKYSYKTPKGFAEDIRQSTSERGYGHAKQILLYNSIADDATKAGVDMDEVDVNSREDWAGRGGVHKRAKEVGLDGEYSAMYGHLSHAIHGNWEDLYTFYLAERDGRFILNRAEVEWSHEILLGEILLLARATLEMISNMANVPEDDVKTLSSETKETIANALTFASVTDEKVAIDEKRIVEKHRIIVIKLLRGFMYVSNIDGCNFTFTIKAHTIAEHPINEYAYFIDKRIVEIQYADIDEITGGMRENDEIVLEMHRQWEVSYLQEKTGINWNARVIRKIHQSKRMHFVELTGYSKNVRQGTYYWLTFVHNKRVVVITTKAVDCRSKMWFRAIVRGVSETIACYDTQIDVLALRDSIRLKS